MNIKNTGYKFITSLLIIFVLFISSTNFAFAQGLDDACAANVTGAYYYPHAMICPLIRVFNLLAVMSVPVFIIMFGLAMYKYATASGDPKGLQGAQQTMTFAVVGFLVVLSTFTILLIMGNLFDLDVANYLTGRVIFDNLYDAMSDFLSIAGINAP